MGVIRSHRTGDFQSSDHVFEQASVAAVQDRTSEPATIALPQARVVLSQQHPLRIFSVQILDEQVAKQTSEKLINFRKYVGGRRSFAQKCQTVMIHLPLL